MFKSFANQGNFKRNTVDSRAMSYKTTNSISNTSGISSLNITKNSYYSLKEQKDFYSIGLKFKMSIPSDNPSKQIAISDLLARANQLKVHPDHWREFLKRELMLAKMSAGKGKHKRNSQGSIF